MYYTGWITVLYPSTKMIKTLHLLTIPVGLATVAGYID